MLYNNYYYYYYYHPLHHSYSLDYSTPQHSQSYPVNQRYLTLSHTPQKSSLPSPACSQNSNTSTLMETPDNDLEDVMY
jgi:hypothetical protein